MNKKFLISLILIIQGFVIIYLLQSLVFAEIYLILLRLLMVLYTIITFYLIRNLNFSDIKIYKEDKKDQSNQFDISVLEKNYHKRS
jgi:small-conductance mechanosensitive channel